MRIRITRFGVPYMSDRRSRSVVSYRLRQLEHHDGLYSPASRSTESVGRLSLGHINPNLSADPGVWYPSEAEAEAGKSA